MVVVCVWGWGGDSLVMGNAKNSLRCHGNDLRWCSGALRTSLVLLAVRSLGVVESSAFTASTQKKKNKTWKDWRREFTMGNRDTPVMEYRSASPALAN